MRLGASSASVAWVVHLVRLVHPLHFKRIGSKYYNVVMMPESGAWLEAFGRIVRGQSSLREEAEGLGVNHTTVMRRFQAWTEGEVERARSEFAQLHEATQRVRGELDNLKREYDRKKAEAEAKLRSDMGKMDEELRRATVKAEGDHKKRMSELDAELSAKEELLHEFKKVGLEPTQGLVLLKKDRDLDKAIAWKSERLKALERKAADLEQNTKDMKENHDAWRWHRDAAREETTKAEAKYRWLVQNIQNKQVEMNTISTYLNDLEEKRSALEPLVDNLRREHGELVNERDKLIDAIESLRVRHTQLSSDYDQLHSQFDQLLAKAKHVDDEAVEKISRRLDRADIAFEAKCKALYEELARRRREGEVEVEKQIRELAGDRLEKLQVSLERLEITRIELMEIGVQRRLMIDELMKLEEKIEEKRRELEKMTSIPSLVAVGQ